MMHPKHERARVLDEALRVAVEQLQDPIEAITVARDHILVTTRSGRLRLGYDYAQGLSSDRQHIRAWSSRLRPNASARAEPT